MNLKIREDKRQRPIPIFGKEMSRQIRPTLCSYLYLNRFREVWVTYGIGWYKEQARSLVLPMQTLKYSLNAQCHV